MASMVNVHRYGSCTWLLSVTGFLLPLTHLSPLQVGVVCSMKSVM